MIKQGLQKTTAAPFVLFFLFIAAFTACKKDTNIEPRIVLGGAEQLQVSSKLTEQVIAVLTNSGWTATTDADWIQLTSTEGEKGKVDVKFVVLENTGDERTGTITLSTVGGSGQKVITVVQESGLTDNFFVKPGGSGNGKSWTNAADLQYALDQAVSGSTIFLAAGVYTPSKTITGGDEADAGDLTFEIHKNITLRGGYPADATGEVLPDAETHKTVLSGETTLGNSYHVVTITATRAPEEKVVLDGLTITGGNASSKSTFATVSGTEFRRDYGGGISIGNAVAEVLNCRITENGSDKFVAGMYVFGGSHVTIRDTKITGNISKGNGAGLWANASEVYVFDSEISGNQTPGTAAGVHGYPEATVYLYNTTVANNKGNSYGAGV